MRRMAITALAVQFGCTSGAGDVLPDEGLAVLSPTIAATGTTTSGLVDVSDRVEAMSRPRDHDRPTDLAFNPEVNGELWVVNKLEDSVTIIDDAGGPTQEADVIVDPYALHFMEEVSSIAFGAPGTFATCQDSRNTYNDQSPANDFMGPTLWSSDRSVFGITNPDAVDLLGFNLGSHIDMLHESPQCMGIAWDVDNVYWVFDGFHSKIVRYDFVVDHGPGYDDHSDGIVSRNMATDVSRVNGVVSHVILDHDSGLLYVADSGNNRIMVLDTNTGRRGADLGSRDCWDGTCVDSHEWRGSDWTLLVDGTTLDMVWPSGIDLIEDTLFVTDAGTNEILAFDLSGELLGRAWTGIEENKAIGGIFAVSMDELWFVDQKNNQVLRLESP